MPRWANELLRRPLATADDLRSCHAEINRLRRDLVLTAETRSLAATEELLRTVIAAEDRIVDLLRSNRFGDVTTSEAGDKHSELARRQPPDPGAISEAAAITVSRERRRILMVCRWWAGTGVGGSATVNRELACALARMGHEVIVRTGSPVDEWTPPSGVTLIGPRSYDPDLPPEDQLDADLNHLPAGIDTIISHRGIGGWAARFIRHVRFPDARLIHFQHVDDATCEANRGQPKKGAAIKFLEAELSAEADVVVGVGPVLTDVAGELAAKSARTPVVHELLPGIDVVEQLTQPPLEGRPKVLLMGRLHSDRKGVHEAAQIARSVRQRGGGIDLILVGAQPETRERTQRMLSHIAGQEVEVLAYTTDPEQKLEVLRRAHVFVMPSRAESFGLVCTEALAAGLPVLAPDSSGFGRFLCDRFPNEISRRMVVPQDYAGPVLIETWADRITLGDTVEYPQPVADALSQLRQVVEEDTAVTNDPLVDPARHLLSRFNYRGTQQLPVTLDDEADEMRRQLAADRAVAGAGENSRNVVLTELRGMIVGGLLQELAARLAPGPAFGPGSNGEALAALVTELSMELLDQTFIGRQ